MISAAVPTPVQRVPPKELKPSWKLTQTLPEPWNEAQMQCKCNGCYDPQTSLDAGLKHSWNGAQTLIETSMDQTLKHPMNWFRNEETRHEIMAHTCRDVHESNAEASNNSALKHHWNVHGDIAQALIET